MSEGHGKRSNLSPLGLSFWMLLVAFAVRVGSLEAQSLWRDEVDQWRFALQPWAEMSRNFIRAGWNGPLYSLLLRGWIVLTGETAFALRYFSVLWGVLGVALALTLMRRLAGGREARWAAYVMALSPYLVWYAQEVKMYTWVPALTLLALYALERACERRQWRWWGTVLLATTLAFYSHILAALLIPVEVLWFWLCERRHPQAWRRGGLVLALLVVPYLPLLRWQLPLLLRVRETGFPAYTLGEMVAVLLSGWSFGIAIGGAFWDRLTVTAMGAFGLLALLGAGRLALARRWRELGKSLSWIGVPLLSVWAISQRGPIFADRYLIWCAPAFYLLVGSGLAALRRLWPLLLVGLTVIEGAGLYKQAAYPIKPQFREAARYLLAHRAPGELLLFQIPYNHHVVGYYFDGRPLDPWAEAPYTNWRDAEGRYRVGEDYVHQQMRTLLAGHHTLWLVYSEVALWDDRELVRGWLNTHGTLTEVLPLHGVTLYHYVLEP